MNTPHNTLDPQIIQNLYTFGSLKVYKLEIFDPITFQIISPKLSFNEEVIKELKISYEKRNFSASISSYYVPFDGAFSSNPPNTTE